MVARIKARLQAFDWETACMAALICFALVAVMYAAAVLPTWLDHEAAKRFFIGNCTMMR